jgi:hypothetical protein
MGRLVKQFISGSKLYYFTEIHNGNSVTYVFDYPQVVRYKQIGELVSEI